MDYKNGKIYVIRNHCNDFVYVGSTTQSLSKRFSVHKARMKFTKIQLYQAFEELRIENFYIELLELYPCSCKDELYKKEGEYIRKFDSYKNGYNMRIEGRTSKEYYEDNEVLIKQKRKENYEDNKGKVKEKSKEYYEINKDKINKKFNCECGGKYTMKHKATHLKTKKHLKYIETSI